MFTFEQYMVKKLVLNLFFVCISLSMFSQESQVIEIKKQIDGLDKLKTAGMGSGLIGCFWYYQHPEIFNGISLIDENTGNQSNFIITNVVDGSIIRGKQFVGISFIPIQSIIYMNNNNLPKLENFDLVGNLKEINGIKKQLIFINSQTKQFLYGPNLWTSSANKIEYDFIHEELIADQVTPLNPQWTGSAVAVNIYDGSSYFSNEWMVGQPNDWQISPQRGFNINDNTSCNYNPVQPLIRIMLNWIPNHYTSTNFGTDGRDINVSWYSNNYIGGSNAFITTPTNSQDQIELVETRISFEDNDEDLCDRPEDLKYFISFGEKGILNLGQSKFFIGFDPSTSQPSQVILVERFLEDMTHRK